MNWYEITLTDREVEIARRALTSYVDERCDTDSALDVARDLDERLMRAKRLV